jgi:hypothetical protein
VFQHLPIIIKIKNLIINFGFIQKQGLNNVDKLKTPTNDGNNLGGSDIQVIDIIYENNLSCFPHHNN